jgi:hypothetical protein
MLRALTFSAVMLVSTVSGAVDFRWTRGFGQGTIEAIIRNGNKASVNIYCPSGQADSTPGMFIETGKVNPKPKERVAVQIVVDGKNYPFDLEETQLLASTGGSRTALDSLVRALIDAKQKSFTVEFPKQRVVERFSLSGARRALADGKDSILDDCPP